jgi:hypothetical protein
MHQILVEYHRKIQRIFVSIRPDSNVNLPRPTYIHSNSQGFSSELLLFLLGDQGGGSTCPGEARVQRVKEQTHF